MRWVERMSWVLKCRVPSVSPKTDASFSFSKLTLSVISTWRAFLFFSFLHFLNYFPSKNAVHIYLFIPFDNTLLFFDSYSPIFFLFNLNFQMLITHCNLDFVTKLSFHLKEECPLHRRRRKKLYFHNIMLWK